MLGTQQTQPGLAADYKRKRAEENGPLILRVFTILAALVSVLAVIHGVITDGADAYFAIFKICVFSTFGYGGGALVLRFTAFGKTNLEEFATALATVILLAFSFLHHLGYEGVSSWFIACLGETQLTCAYK